MTSDRFYQKDPGRNPFLFRGPIPTGDLAMINLEEKIKEVAIPSYSEVLFLHRNRVADIPASPRVAIPSYSEVLFLPVAAWRSYLR